MDLSPSSGCGGGFFPVLVPLSRPTPNGCQLDRRLWGVAVAVLRNSQPVLGHHVLPIDLH